MQWPKWTVVWYTLCNWSSIERFLKLVHTADTDKTRQFGLVLSVSAVWTSYDVVCMHDDEKSDVGCLLIDIDAVVYLISSYRLPFTEITAYEENNKYF